MQTKKVLVTGASGFIGRELVAELAREGMEVFVLIRRETKASSAGGPAASSPRVVVGDVRNYEEVAAALRHRRVDVVVHLAAVVQRSGTKASSQIYLKTNLGGTINICRACLEAGVKRLVHISSADVHGPGSFGRLIDEQCPYAPMTDYEVSKAAADKFVLDYAKKGLETIVLRPTLVYGHPCSTFFRWLFRYAGSRLIPVLGDGLTLKHFVHLTDLLECILLAMESPLTGRAYIVADGSPLTINRLLVTVSSVVNREGKLIHLPAHRDAIMNLSKLLPWRLGYSTSWFFINRAYRTDAARAELGYSPRVDLREGLADLFGMMRCKKRLEA